MFRLRKVRLPNVVSASINSRNVVYKTSVRLCSSNVENSKTFYSKSKKFEPKTEEGRLTFTLPDLSPREETFVKQQIRIVLQPDCLQTESVEGVCRFLDLKSFS